MTPFGAMLFEAFRPQAEAQANLRRMEEHQIRTPERREPATNFAERRSAD